MASWVRVRGVVWGEALDRGQGLGWHLPTPPTGPEAPLLAQGLPLCTQHALPNLSPEDH